VGSACSNRTVSLTTRFFTVSVDYHSLPSGNSHSSAALALSGPLTPLVPLISLRTPHRSFCERPYHRTISRSSTIFLSWLSCVVTQSLVHGDASTLTAPPLWWRPPSTLQIPELCASMVQYYNKYCYVWLLWSFPLIFSNCS